jgi:hypothetical protein
MRRWILLALLILVVLPLAGFAAWTWAALKFAYSSGERAGYVQKISNKGWVCKTWEGELSMTTQPGAIPQIFAFSVRDEAVAQKIMKAAGQKVTLSYEQHRAVPTNCFGETEYFVTNVQPQPEPVR